MKNYMKCPVIRKEYGTTDTNLEYCKYDYSDWYPYLNVVSQ